MTCRRGRGFGEGGGGKGSRDEECEEVRGGSQVVGCWWHSLTGLHPQRLAVPLCSALHLVENKQTKRIRVVLRFKLFTEKFSFFNGNRVKM